MDNFQQPLRIHVKEHEKLCHKMVSEIFVDYGLCQNAFGKRWKFKWFFFQFHHNGCVGDSSWSFHVLLHLQPNPKCPWTLWPHQVQLCQWNVLLLLRNWSLHSPSLGQLHLWNPKSRHFFCHDCPWGHLRSLIFPITNLLHVSQIWVHVHRKIMKAYQMCNTYAITFAILW